MVSMGSTLMCQDVDIHPEPSSFRRTVRRQTRRVFHPSISRAYAIKCIRRVQTPAPGSSPCRPIPPGPGIAFPRSIGSRAVRSDTDGPGEEIHCRS